MKAKLLFVSISLIIIAACNKDKFESTPTLTFETINGNTFSQGQNVQIKLRLTDKEGDFLIGDGEDSGYMKKCVFYQRFSYKCQDDEDSVAIDYKVPVFPTNKYLDVNLDIQYTYGTEEGQFPSISGCRPPYTGDDSTYFKIWVIDEAGHVSDTVTTPAFTLPKI